MAKTLSKSCEDRPLVVMIDELDRCRPSYAVELLEVAKHLFSVDHIVFVLAVNRSELAHAIRALYGGGFDAKGYLRRFFDVDFVLPAPERNAFIEDRLNATRINDYFRQYQHMGEGIEFQTVRNLLRGFLGTPDLSLRRIAQAIHRLGLVLASLQQNNLRAFPTTTVVALILRTIDADLYHRFVRGEISDLEVVYTVFARPEAKALRQTPEGRIFEATIIIAAQEETIVNSLESEKISSPLLERYTGLAHGMREPTLDTTEDDPDQEHAEHVIGTVESFRKTGRAAAINFKEAVRRLEVLSADLKDETLQ